MPTNYPIILVHGIFAKNIGPIGGFGSIPKKIKKAGFSIYVGEHDAFGSIENNAAFLHSQIEEILKKEKTDKINIIAHSKGGLDSIYMIKYYHMENKIASFTTICTPHRGTALADFVVGWYAFPRALLTKTVDLVFKLLGDKHADSLTVLRQLSESAPYFPCVEPFSEFYCQSYASEFRHALGDPYIALTLLIYRKLRKGSPSDGAVPVDSARYGVWRGMCIDASASHRQIIDFIAIFGKKRKKVHQFYVNICLELAAMGY